MIEILAFTASFFGLITGAWVTAVVINRYACRKPAWQMLALSITFLFISIALSQTNNLFLAIALEFSTWITVAAASLAWVYYRHYDIITNILLNWGKLPFLWK